MRRRGLLVRASAAVGASLALHLLLGALVVGSTLWNGWPKAQVDVEITGMRLEDLNDLPLGLPAAGEKKPDDGVAAPAPPPPVAAAPPTAKKDRSQPKPRPKPRPKREPDAGVQAAGPADGGGGVPRPTSVRSYAPQGSRVIALMRVDRLRNTVYAAAVDALLVNLPDRRDLLEGTGVDFYRDIDALLIATPNPMDARVTFLAARHRLTDGAMRAALERGARATERKLTWRTERGRPFAERRSSGAAGKAPSGPRDRDERLILLAAPSLVVVTPPAYRSLILRGRTGSAPAVAPAGQEGGAEAGSGSDGGAALADGGVQGRGHGGEAEEGTGGGAGAGAGAGGGEEAPGWAALLRRIDAEDSIMPPDGVAMVSAVDLFSARSLRDTLDVAPGTRGAVDDLPTARVKAPAGGATIMGLPVPRLLSATLGVTPQPFADVDATFDRAADARQWEEEWPALRHKLLTNPLVVLSGFSALVGRATVTRTGSAIRLRIEATELETTRILQLLAAQLSTLRR